MLIHQSDLFIHQHLFLKILKSIFTVNFSLFILPFHTCTITKSAKTEITNLNVIAIFFHEIKIMQQIFSYQLFLEKKQTYFAHQSPSVFVMHLHINERFTKSLKNQFKNLPCYGVIFLLCYAKSILSPKAKFQSIHRSLEILCLLFYPGKITF